MAWVNTLSTITPAGTDSPRAGDDRIRELKAAFVERLDIDLYFPLNTNQVSDTAAGEHRKITIRSLSADDISALEAAKAYIYHRATDGELYFKDASGNTTRLTIDGRIDADDTDIRLRNNNYLKAVNAAGTGTVNLVKASTGNIPVLADGAQLASDSPPSVDAGIANKKYVDDAIVEAVEESLTPLGPLQTTDSTGTALALTKVYNAPCDGTVTWYGTINSTRYVMGSVGATPSPATPVSRIGNASLSDVNFGQSFEVAKDEYWKVTSDGVNNFSLYWRPRGTGACVRQ
jgi:hypothetical protein